VEEEIHHVEVEVVDTKEEGVEEEGEKCHHSIRQNSSTPTHLML
jgi:hypothetical protein